MTAGKDVRVGVRVRVCVVVVVAVVMGAVVVVLVVVASGVVGRCERGAQTLPVPREPRAQVPRAAIWRTSHSPSCEQQ